MSKENQGAALDLFGCANEISVQRALAEFRAGRPIVMNADASGCVVLPLDGATRDNVEAFRSICAPATLRLAITSRRARFLGLETAGPVLLDLAPQDALSSIWELATSIDSASAPKSRPAGPAVVASIALAKLAQRLPALLVAELSSASEVADDRRLIAVQADAVLGFRSALVDSVALAGKSQVPLGEGVAACFHVFHDAGGGSPVAIVIGNPDLSRVVPVRLHSACLTGDVFGSRRCDCGAQLQLAIARLSESGGGIILYLEQEGRGLGLANKMRAYALQDEGLDTVDANTALGFDDDERDYGVAARMLKLLGCNRILLMTNNPGKLEALSEAGVEIAGRMPLFTPVNADNRRYLAAKAARAGHWLDAAYAAEDDDQAERLESTSGP